MQRELTPRLGALGATLVRFLFGFPFALLFLAVVLALDACRPAGDQPRLRCCGRCWAR